MREANSTSCYQRKKRAKDTYKSQERIASGGTSKAREPDHGTTLIRKGGEEKCPSMKWKDIARTWKRAALFLENQIGKRR